LYSGTDHIVIDLVSFSSPGAASDAGTVKNFTLDGAMTADSSGNFVDFVAKYGVDSIKVMDKEYGPAHFDVSLRHIDARTFAKLMQAGRSPESKNPVVLMQYFDTILQHDPEMSLDRISFNHPDGEAALSGLFKVKGAQPGDMMNPQVLAGKIYSSVDLKMPERLFIEMAQSMFAQRFAQSGGIDQALAKMLAEGYLTREGGFIKTKFEFHDSQASLNGKPLGAPGNP
jgi:uncharacterized protein YdgA (DUF945 family)